MGFARSCKHAPTSISMHELTCGDKGARAFLSAHTRPLPRILPSNTPTHLRRCKERARKLKKATLMSQWKLSAGVDHILQDIEDAHYVFRSILLHALGADFPAPALPFAPATARSPSQAPFLPERPLPVWEISGLSAPLTP